MRNCALCQKAGLLGSVGEKQAINGSNSRTRTRFWISGAVPITDSIINSTIIHPHPLSFPSNNRRKVCPPGSKRSIGR